MAPVVLAKHSQLHPTNGWTTPVSGSYTAMSYLGFWDDFKRETTWYPKITSAASKIVDGATRGAGHLNFTWNTNYGLSETHTPRYEDGNYSYARVRAVSGPGVSDLRFGEINIPNARPQVLGGPGTNPISGLDEPLARSTAGAFFDSLLRPGGSLSGAFVSALTVELSIGLGSIRDTFQKLFAPKLRDYFSNQPNSGLPAPPPPPDGFKSDWCIYVVGEELGGASTPSGDNTTYIPGQGLADEDGGKYEELIEGISTSLDSISSQLAAMTEILGNLRQPGDTPGSDEREQKVGFLDLVQSGLSILGNLMGLGDSAADTFGDAVGIAKNTTGGIDSLLDTIEDVIDDMGGGGQGDMLDDRFKQMSDLLTYEGKSIPYYLSQINQALREPSQSSGSLSKEALIEVLDRYFMDPANGGVEGVRDFSGPGLEMYSIVGELLPKAYFDGL